MQFLSNERIENLVSVSLKNIFDEKSLPLYDMMSYHYGFHEDILSNQIRPHQGTLLLVGVDSFGGEVESALPAALAIELLNAFCQVHDDVESGRPSSQGRDSLWWVWGPGAVVIDGQEELGHAPQHFMCLPTPLGRPEPSEYEKAPFPQIPK